MVYPVQFTPEHTESSAEKGTAQMPAPFQNRAKKSSYSSLYAFADAYGLYSCHIKKTAYLRIIYPFGSMRDPVAHCLHILSF